MNPTFHPTKYPSLLPTIDPTNEPTFNPSRYPSLIPTIYPSDDPTTFPSDNRTFYPTNVPSNNPSFVPTTKPTYIPTENPLNGDENVIIDTTEIQTTMNEIKTEKLSFDSITFSEMMQHSNIQIALIIALIGGILFGFACLSTCIVMTMICRNKSNKAIVSDANNQTELIKISSVGSVSENTLPAMPMLDSKQAKP